MQRALTVLLVRVGLVLWLDPPCEPLCLRSSFMGCCPLVEAVVRRLGLARFLAALDRRLVIRRRWAVARAQVRRASRCQLRLERRPPALLLRFSQLLLARRYGSPNRAAAALASPTIGSKARYSGSGSSTPSSFSPSMRAESAPSHSPLRTHFGFWLMAYSSAQKYSGSASASAVG